MRLRPKAKELLPKIAEVLISIEIDSLELIIEIVRRGVLLCQCTSCLKVFFLC